MHICGDGIFSLKCCPCLLHLCILWHDKITYLFEKKYNPWANYILNSTKLCFIFYSNVNYHITSFYVFLVGFKSHFFMCLLLVLNQLWMLISMQQFCLLPLQQSFPKMGSFGFWCSILEELESPFQIYSLNKVKHGRSIIVRNMALTSKLKMRIILSF
jgi:hypothetical protein